FLRQMHATDLKLARSSGLEHADYAAHFDGLSKQVAQALWSKLCITERALVKRTIADLLESHGRARFRPALLHGDLSPDHVLYDPDSASVMAVIDFGDMIIGDPAWDFICIYEDYGPDFLFRALREYGPADQVALLIRMHRLYLLGAIEWTVQLFEREAEDAEASVAELIETLEVQSSKLDELLSNGLARETS
ncbi:MAG: phosphotransferase family protein, partial [Gammaproteobacteria bacterium]